MTKRKIILLSIAVFLLIVCIVQGITGNINPVKTIKTELSPDLLTITSQNETIELSLKNGTWYIGKNDYIANKSDVETMIKNLSEIKVLDKIGKTGNEFTDEKYSLNTAKQKKITAFSNGKELKSLTVGKSSSTGAQTYITLDNSKDIYLVAGNLSSIFGKSEDSLKAKTVYTIEEDDVTGATVTKENKTFGIRKNGNNWEGTESLEGTALNQDSTQSWIRNIAFLNVQNWTDDSVNLPEEKTSSVTVYSKTESITVDIYTVKSGEEEKIYGKCTKTPHIFELSKYLSEKFTKDLLDLKAE